jgi:hypothetical protein
MVSDYETFLRKHFRAPFSQIRRDAPCDQRGRQTDGRFVRVDPFESPFATIGRAVERRFFAVSRARFVVAENGKQTVAVRPAPV